MCGPGHPPSYWHRFSIFSTIFRQSGSSSTTRTRKPMGNPCGFTGGDMATGRASNGGVPGVFKPYGCAYGPVGSLAFFPGTRESTGRELSFRGAARSSARLRVGTQHQMSVSHQKYSTRRVRGDASCDSFPRTKGQRVSIVIPRDWMHCAPRNTIAKTLSDSWHSWNRVDRLKVPFHARLLSDKQSCGSFSFFSISALIGKFFDHRSN